ncbi:hypothetical protein ACERJO_20285 [Halalkalibacter sp. AB-rgal2]|uniref:hypothetical protein n=1 Tax=Halalkalibacter sp. AB-rgal2 TaxID=3242695 RepID=UPI00359E7847
MSLLITFIVCILLFLFSTVKWERLSSLEKVERIINSNKYNDLEKYNQINKLKNTVHFGVG